MQVIADSAHTRTTGTILVPAPQGIQARIRETQIINPPLYCACLETPSPRAHARPARYSFCSAHAQSAVGGIRGLLGVSEYTSVGED